jgi:hypothetical protein
VRWTSAFTDKVKEAAELDPAYLEARATVDTKKDLSLEDGLLYRKNRLWVPENLRKDVLESEHDSMVAGHMGMDKTMELVTRNFWWPNLEHSVREYVRSCLECQKNKNPRHAPFGHLQPMELHYRPWQSISMDFITDLPLSEGCDSIWVIVDMFSKMTHFIPLKKDRKKTDDLIRIFAREYWRFHGVPMDIVSDRDSRFTAKLWSDFLRLVGIKSRMSTAFHPQTDGQTERLNQTLEAYLRSFVNYDMSNWAELLPMAEFAYNNSSSASTGTTPFYANYGYHPAGHNPPSAKESSRTLNPASKVYAHWMTTVHAEAATHLEHARARMKQYADVRRTDAPPFVKDQLVMLNARHVRTRRPAKKLDHKMLGPFQITKVISPTAVRLALPKGWRIHDSFHVSLVEPYRAGIQARPDPDQVLREAPPIEGEYSVEEVKDSMETGGKVRYLVKWEGYPAKKDWTWEPFEHFEGEGAQQLVALFHQQNPDKPRDPQAPKRSLEAEP